MDQGKKNLKVAVLGAGASAGAPVISCFFEKAEEYFKAGQINQAFKEVFDYRAEWLPKSNIEEFLSYLDFQIEMQIIPPPEFVHRINGKIRRREDNCMPLNNILKQVNHTKDRIKHIRKLTISLISQTLNEALKIDSKAEKSIQAYKELIKQFDVTISFNWDILYESTYNELTSKNLKPPQLGIDRFRLCFPALLKMHGSLNWAYCKKCTLLVSTEKFEHKAYADGKKCEICGQHILIPLTIFPGLTKFQAISGNETNSNDFSYRDIWFAAMEALLKAEKVVFFGYSLSEADPYSSLFFKSMIAKNTNTDLLIEVVRPDNNETEDVQLKERYKKTFGNRIKQTDFKNMTFEDYFKSA